MKGIGFGSIFRRIDFLLREIPNLALEVMALFQVLERINNNAYRLDPPKEYGVSNTFNITDLIPFAGVVDSDDVGSIDLRKNPLQEGGDDAFLPRRGPIPRAMARRLQED